MIFKFLSGLTNFDNERSLRVKKGREMLLQAVGWLLIVLVSFSSETISFGRFCVCCVFVL